MASFPTQEQIETLNEEYGSQYALATEVNHLLTDVAANQTAAINALHKHQKMKITPLSLLTILSPTAALPLKLSFPTTSLTPSKP